MSAGTAVDHASSWSPALFLDKAEELRRRLSLWPIRDLTKPIQGAVSLLELQSLKRRLFRTDVLTGEHGSKPEYVKLFSGLVSKEHEGKGFAGSAFHDSPDEMDKQYTLWLLRDFHDHLPDAGSTPKAEYLRLKIKRILDEPMYCDRRPADDIDRDLLNRRRGNEGDGPYSLVGGRTLDAELLDGLVEAARALFNENGVRPNGRQLTSSLRTDSARKNLKRNTGRGAGEAKIIAALTKHHRFKEDSGLTCDPIGNNKLAKTAAVSPSTASDFFKRRCQGYPQYLAICRERSKLANWLKVLNCEFSRDRLYGRRPPGEGNRDDGVE